MVPLPLFKLAALFVRHISKYGANRIKLQAHEHPGFRRFAAKHGQTIHQLNMRLSVALLRDVEAEIKAKEKAEAPTVKTKEQTEREREKDEAKRAKYGTTAKESHATKEVSTSVWRRKFRPLSEAKAVDLFADVIGDAFILIVAGVLVIYEYYRSSQKPDANLEKIKELNLQLEGFKKKEEELAAEDKKREERIAAVENALRNYKDPKTKQPLLPTPMLAP